MEERTLDNCELVVKFGKPIQYNRYCYGFAKSEIDDEPPEICKECPLHYINKDDVK